MDDPSTTSRLRFGMLLCGCLVWVAVLNGYPLLFDDSGQYFQTAVVRHYAPFDRPVIYGWFLYLTSFNISPWLSVVAQAALCLWMIDLSRRTLFAALPAAATVHVVLVLATVSMLPFFVSQVMPDFFSGLVPLAVALLVLHFDRLSARERLALGIMLFFAVGAHTSHLPSVAVALVVSAAFRLWTKARALATGSTAWWQLTRGALAVVASITAAVVALAATNFVTYGRVTLSPGSHVFLMGRLLADGTAVEYLKRHCPDAGFKICSYLDEIPADANDYIWHAPLLKKLGNWAGSREESVAIISGTLREQTAAVARNALWAGLRQFLDPGIKDTVAAVPPDHSLHTGAFKKIYPQDTEEFAASLQQQGRLATRAFFWLSMVQKAAFWCALVGLLWVLVKVWTRQRAFSGTAVTCLAFLLSNAFVCGALSGVFERYQGRVTWIVLLLLTLWILDRRHSQVSSDRRGTDDGRAHGY